jgi:uncharacterized protein YegJ (DUF2314 family)
MKVRAILAVGAMLVLVAACERGPTYSPGKTVGVSKEDAAVNGAIARARAEIDTFIARLRHPAAGDSGFSVKAPITDGKETEHFWLTGVTFDGAAFHGTINNTPEYVHTVQFGQAWTMGKAEASDWMYVSDGKLVGGYTIRAIRDMMNKQERAKLDAELPFKID